MMQPDETDIKQAPKSASPLPSELIAMSEDERQRWIDLSFELAKDMVFEQFDAFGEEYF